MSEQQSNEQTTPALGDIEVVLVSYRSRDHVEALLSGWPRDLAVVVVDNSGNTDQVAELTERYPQLRYVDGGGQGFGRAANLGAFSSSKPIILFVNPDSRPSITDLLTLAEGVSTDPTALAHAATTVGREGVVEIGVGGWEPSPLRCLVYALGLHKKWPRAGLFAQPQLGHHEQVDWTSGACMAVPSSRFRAVGGFDEAFFVYAEDMALGRRGRQAGFRSVLREDVVVAHNAGGSGAPSSEMLRMRGASFAYYVIRYHSRFSAQLMRAILAGGSLLRAARSSWAKNPSEARLHVEFTKGTLTRRAFVNGSEVSGRRYQEVVGRERVDVLSEEPKS